ncbi:MAG: M20/M25/M40 family metallo-hydrolase [Clostridia bacterium]|nr:M20/M25/M40 family metallo-hydrolase [Clostridia bacterium]
MDLSKLIEKKADYAQYMFEEIKHICTKFEKRDPGSNGEKQACEYMGGVLKDLGCDKVDVESFKENPKSFYGWIYITITCVLAAIALFFCGTLTGNVVLPIIGVVLIVFGLALALLQFGVYKKTVDALFPEKTGHNVTALKKPTGEVKRRIIFNGHPDAAWEWPVNYKLGGVGFEGHAILCAVGAVFYIVLNVLAAVKVSSGAEVDGLVKVGLWGLLFVPFLVGLYFMVNYKIVVDGANDNLSGCYMGIAVLKALKDAGIELENTEVGVVLTGSEEAGLRGAKAWCEAHKNDFNDVPTFIYSYDTIHDPKYLLVNYRDLNATVKADKDVSDLFMECAQELGVTCNKGMVPPLGGATDSAAFAQAGFRATGITGLNHKLESYYHTRKDSWDNMNLDGLADCFAVSVRVLEKFDGGAKQ